MNNLFRSIIEMAIPGFMMYLFQGFESKFFDSENKDQDEDMNESPEFD